MTTVEAWVSPLQEVERAVQERAKTISLDLAADGGAERLRALIGDEVARWSEDYKRGLREFDLADPATVVERAYRNLAGYGPLEPLLGYRDVNEPGRTAVAGSPYHLAPSGISQHETL